MKKFLKFGFAVCVVMGLAGCGDDNECAVFIMNENGLNEPPYIKEGSKAGVYACKSAMRIRTMDILRQRSFKDSGRGSASMFSVYASIEKEELRIRAKRGEIFSDINKITGGVQITPEIKAKFEQADKAFALLESKSSESEFHDNFVEALGKLGECDKEIRRQKKADEAKTGAK
ncbi:hypothetical protein OFN97_03930 [Campylobacter sp. VBCF_05 NA6]|uniref:hypothetical protein n=1 Tax=unclassified Campylobacter TaxID=2593542 RepID=UPI0022E9E187|nr:MULTISPECIES: hypothetical protein [unclassified Campylobacter]MDA3057260.1 hypothetical protein [Campylobacter sp. VBCF_04 NA7]MDA3059168.1 hypothetical protein [Campylobacter sp. VBCF_05 NA6]